MTRTQHTRPASASAGLSAQEQSDPMLTEALKGPHGSILREALRVGKGDAVLALALDVAMLTQVLYRRAADHLEAESQARDDSYAAMFKPASCLEARA